MLASSAAEAVSVLPSNSAPEEIHAKFIVLRKTPVRVEPSPTATVLDTLPPKTTIEVSGRVGREWLRVEWKGKIGFVQAQALRQVPPAEPKPTPPPIPSPPPAQPAAALPPPPSTPPAGFDGRWVADSHRECAWHAEVLVAGRSLTGVVRVEGPISGGTKFEAAISSDDLVHKTITFEGQPLWFFYLDGKFPHLTIEMGVNTRATNGNAPCITTYLEFKRE